MNTFTEKELLRLSKSLNNKMNLIQEDTPGRTWGDTATGMWHKITDIGNDNDLEGINRRLASAKEDLDSAKNRLKTVSAEIDKLLPQKDDGDVYSDILNLETEQKELRDRINYKTNFVNRLTAAATEFKEKNPLATPAAATPAAATPAAATPAAATPAAQGQQPAAQGQQPPAQGQQPAAQSSTPVTGASGNPAGVKISSNAKNDGSTHNMSGDNAGLRKDGDIEIYKKQVKYNIDNPNKPQITTDGIAGPESAAAGISAPVTGAGGRPATKPKGSTKTKTTSQKNNPVRTSMIKQMQSDLGVRQSGDFDQETTNALISRPDVAASYGMRPPTPKPNRPASIAAKKPAEPAPFDYAQRFNETTTFSSVPTINRMRELAGLK